ncbi:MAG TPA: hypothetical protein VGR90_10705 [Acidimicrobiales bacterium]|nr:hypothetical protein [Acidimicrobiales bacterium]
MAATPAGTRTLARALVALGAGAEEVGGAAGDTLLVRPGRGTPAVAVRVRSCAHADPVRVAALLAEERGPGSQVTVLVADWIPEPARQLLRTRGWGWLDRRGHLRLTGPGLLIDAAVPPLTRRSLRRTPGIRGVGGLTWAAAVLMAPDGRPVLREVARRSGLAPSTLAVAARTLRESAPAAPAPRGDGGGPAVQAGPELFWALVAAWPPVWSGLADAPRPEDEGVAGWAVTGRAAAASGPAGGDTAGRLAVGGPGDGSEAAPRFYVAGAAELERALDRYGEAVRRPAAHVAVEPTPLVLADLPSAREGGWPAVAPLFAAVDVAAEGAEGVAFLESWEPASPGRRWWAA